MTNANIVTEIFGGTPTVWNWVAGIVNLLVIAAFVNYGVTWLYRRQGWNRKGKKSASESFTERP